MASSGSGYDLSASTFSPDGRIFQVEYATKAVANAGTVLGIHAKDGVVLGVAKPLQRKMIVPTTASYKRIHTIDVNCGIASTGFIPDTKVLVARGGEEASDYFEYYGVKIPPHVLADRLGQYVHYFTLHGALRPFGASCVLAGYDTETKSHGLYMVEPNGTAYQYYGVACGKGKQVAKTELEKLNLNKPQAAKEESGDSVAATTLSVKEAIQQIVKILMLLHQENKEQDGKPMELELSWICEESNNTHKPVPKDLINKAKEWAKEQLDEEEDDDEDDDDEEGEDDDEAMEEG